MRWRKKHFGTPRRRTRGRNLMGCFVQTFHIFLVLLVCNAWFTCIFRICMALPVFCHSAWYLLRRRLKERETNYIILILSFILSSLNSNVQKCLVSTTIEQRWGYAAIRCPLLQNVRNSYIVPVWSIDLLAECIILCYLSLKSFVIVLFGACEQPNESHIERRNQFHKR